MLVTEEGECWFDSPIIAEYIELMNVAPAMLPRYPLEPLRLREVAAMADGLMAGGLVVGWGPARSGGDPAGE
ncbi:glutathione S-transferase [Escherichia coli]|nr:glutathione S-transferase [Escherichia coli]